MENARIIKRIQYAVKIRLCSPLCIAGGDSEVTDRDVQRNADDEVFIPGTSLAGAMRQYAQEHTKESDLVKKLFGESNAKSSDMSRIQISDFYFENAKEVKVIVRDGVKLEQKVTVKGAKYDTQAVETGNGGFCYLLLTVREGDNEDGFERIIQNIFYGLKNDAIRLGANKNRGFGRLGVSLRSIESEKTAEIYRKVFTKDNIEDWLNFSKEKWIEEVKEDSVAKTVLWNVYPENENEQGYISICVPLQQKGGISIRSYNVIPGEPDYESLKCADKTVIPGTSWAGAICTRVKEILRLFIKEETRIEQYMREWFGYVEKKEAYQSNVIFSESILEHGIELQVTRNNINRLTGASVVGGLYTEKSYFNGLFKLEIKVRKNYYKKDEDGNVILMKDDLARYENLVGILLLAVKDIQNGYLAVGGQTSIGRGIFQKGTEEMKLSGTDKDEAYYIGTLERLVKGV